MFDATPRDERRIWSTMGSPSVGNEVDVWKRSSDS